MYKIIDTKTGLFSTGGEYPKWTKNGKVWSSLGHIRSHLNMIAKSRASWNGKGHWELTWEELAEYIPDNWEVVELEVLFTIEGSARDTYLCRGS